MWCIKINELKCKKWRWNLYMMHIHTAWRCAMGPYKTLLCHFPELPLLPSLTRAFVLPGCPLSCPLAWRLGLYSPLFPGHSCEWVCIWGWAPGCQRGELNRASPRLLGITSLSTGEEGSLPQRPLPWDYSGWAQEREGTKNTVFPHIWSFMSLYPVPWAGSAASPRAVSVCTSTEFRV